jgi:hypothetical protein
VKRPFAPDWCVASLTPRLKERILRATLDVLHTPAAYGKFDRRKAGYFKVVSEGRGPMSPTHDITPLGAVARGLASGVVGTAAMTVAQSAYYNAQGSEPSTTPAEVAKRILRGVFHRRIDDDKTEALNNAMHWTYGTSWGLVYGLVQGTVRTHAARNGMLFGSLVWARA